MSAITLSQGIRQNLLSLQDTAANLTTTQEHLATGEAIIGKYTLRYQCVSQYHKQFPANTLLLRHRYWLKDPGNGLSRPVQQG
jgi:hypothetical protein